MSQPEPEREVERIISDNILVGKRFFFVKWRGLESSENSWEPEERLSNCPLLVSEYFEGQKPKPNKRRRSSIVPPTPSGRSTRGNRPSVIYVPMPAPDATTKEQPTSDPNPNDLDTQPCTSSSALTPRNPSLKPLDLDLIAVDPDQASTPTPRTSLKPSDLDLIAVDPDQASTPTPRTSLKPSDLDLIAVDPDQASTPTPRTSLKPSDLDLIAVNPDHAISTPVRNSSPLDDSSLSNKRPSRSCHSIFRVGNSPTTPRSSIDLKPTITNVQSLAPLKKSPLSSRPKRKISSESPMLTYSLPKIELVRIDDDSRFPIQFEQTQWDSLIIKSSPRSSPIASLNVSEVKPKVKAKPRGRRIGRPARRLVRTSLRQRASRAPVMKSEIVDLTSLDETDSKQWNSALSTSQSVTDDDTSWHHSTTIEHKAPTKLTVRMFDRAPRPEVLTPVPILENFESDPELSSALVPEDSDKENVSRRRRRGYSSRRVNKRKPTARKLKAKNPESRVEPPNVVLDQPEEEDAMVLLTEQHQSGSNLVMYFPRLKLVKSIPEKMADKYYSEAVIAYYRRSVQPPARVARRSV